MAGIDMEDVDLISDFHRKKNKAAFLKEAIEWRNEITFGRFEELINIRYKEYNISEFFQDENLLNLYLWVTGIKKSPRIKVPLRWQVISKYAETNNLKTL